MPLTAFQKSVLEVLAASRSAESHFAGGVVLNAPDDSPRFSRDFDIFHEVGVEVVRASENDTTRLSGAGFSVEKVSRTDEWRREATFRSARVSSPSGEVLEIDWAADSAFRFFPIEPDAVLGWRLHHFDAATNKALTLASRTETRDYVDILEWHRRFPLWAVCWAACGKDPGFTPLSLLRMMRRFARIDPGELERIQAMSLDPVALKNQWISASDAAELNIVRLADEQPELPIGVAFVDEAGVPGWILDDPTLRLHRPSLRGCWPTVRGLNGV
jgi:hypothetical protein